MASAFQVAGSQEQKPTKYVPIFTNRWFTGLWTQRSPLRDAATPYLYEKFYSGSRYDSLIGGLNTEVTSKLTLARSPGHSVYNSQNFLPINAFYEFHIFPKAGGAGTIKVLADTAANVFDATGPNTKQNILTKSAGSGQTYFQSVGDTLYFANGVDNKQWLQQPNQYATNTTFNVGFFSTGAGSLVVDTNGNLQLAYQRKVGGSSGTVGTVTIDSNNNITLAFNAPFSSTDLAIPQGSLLQFTNFVGASFLNFGTMVVNTVQNNVVNGHGLIIGTLFGFTHAAYGPSADSGMGWVTFGQGTTGNTPPVWQTTKGFFTFDGTVAWENFGPATINWGIAPPTNPPSVSNVPNNSFPAWAANTFYNPSLTISDTVHFQKLTTAGTTGAVQPTWNTTVGGTTTDNTAVWTNVGVVGRLANTAYNVGNMVSVTYSIIKEIPFRDPDTGMIDYNEITLGPYTDTFMCIAAGTTSSGATGTVSWSKGQVSDGTVLWMNVGATLTWTSGPGANKLVSTNTQIDDASGSGGGPGNLENVITAGTSGGTHPSWNTAVGGTTKDGTVSWQNAGPGTSGNTMAWIYAYSYVDTITGHVSTASPASAGIILQGSSLISVSGLGSTDPQVNVIRIWRTVQGGSDLLFLADIAAPANGGAWSYIDSSPDPPNPNSTLDLFTAAPIDNANDPPPTGLINLTYHLGRIWGSVGNLVYYSGGPDTIVGNGNESFPPNNVFAFPNVVMRLQPTSTGLMVFTINGVFVIAGQGTATSTFYDYPFIEGLGLLSYNAFTVNGSVFYMMNTQKIVLELDPSSGQSEVGFPIGDQFAALYNPANAYITWHIGGSSDKALYVADGATGWFRMNPTPAPEVGPPVWSPFRQIAVGCKCVQSVETAPGVHQLLVGPGPVSGGPILKRDLTVFTDNSASYNAFAIVGNCVLAQPGQLAELNFITTECPAVGQRPVMSVLIDEISGTFDTLPANVNDPPMLTPSVSLYSDRWYFSAAQLSAWCRNIQVKISWGNDTNANEIYTYTINGAHYTES